jgi:hypothetical protein
VATAVAVVALTTPAWSQPTYSIDYESISISSPDFTFLVPLTEGDLLATHFLPGVAPPTLATSGGFGPPFLGLGLPVHPGAIGHPPATFGVVEVDALSYGRDMVQDPAFPTPFAWCFSVDEFAVGLAGPIPPNVLSEGATGTLEASADVYSYFPAPAMPPGPWAPFGVPPGNTLVMDGDGTVPIGLLPPVPLGLIEPNIPLPAPPVPIGDNLDALDIDTTVPVPLGGTFPVYYSLDAGTAFIDPLEGPGSGSAIANGGFSGADVLVTGVPGGPPALYAPALALGLDIFGFDTDDLDALVLLENGDGVFTPYTTIFDWVTGASDMIFFSVRRGSAVIGVPDSLFAIPIEESDILMPPAIAGGPPAIYIAGENLSLCTLRSCGPGPFGFGDDLNALDVTPDCDGSGLPDVVEVLTGVVPDINGNGIPDPCECPPCPGDLDGDGVRDLTDFTLFAAAYGSVVGDANYNLCADLDGDGVVDLTDFGLFAAGYGVACP